MGLGVVFASFQDQPHKDDDLQWTLNFLSNHSVRMCYVSTSRIFQDPIKNCMFIERPNVGYDLYSYKVGYEELSHDSRIDKIIFLNSSFTVLDKAKFEKFLLSMIKQLNENPLLGVTSSKQFAFHLQTYLFGVNRNYSITWFEDWLENLSPRDTKFETILNGEIDLSKRAIDAGLNPKSIISKKQLRKIKGAVRFLRYQMRSHSPFTSFRNLLLLGPNPVHANFDDIFNIAGFVKNELILKNPYHLKLSKFNENLGELVSKHSFQESKLELINWNKHNVRIVVIRRGQPVKLAVVLHCHYVDQLQEMHNYLQRIPEPFDLFISTSRESLVPYILDEFNTLAWNLELHIGPNIGRDVAPFVYFLSMGFIAKYDAVLKIHTKRSLYTNLGSAWRRQIFEQLMTSSAHVDNIISGLRLGYIGLIGPSLEWVTSPDYWGSSRIKYFRLSRQLGLRSSTTSKLGYFAGTMFWFNPVALQPLGMLSGDELQFSLEHNQRDGTLAHAIERLLPHIVRARGYKVMGTDNLLQPVDELDLNNKLIIN